MQLNKNHREAFLNALEKAKEEKELAELCIQKRKDDFLNEWHDISLFLAQERIKTIEKSLIDNEIDF